jgi:hypothetical protein
MKKNDLVKLLQELVETQRKLITELEKRPVYSQTLVYPQPQICIPSVWQVRCTPGPCVYDQLGTAGGLRYCKQCGQQEIPYTVTVVSSTGSAELDKAIQDGKITGVVLGTPAQQSDTAQVHPLTSTLKTNGQFITSLVGTISRP